MINLPHSEEQRCHDVSTECQRFPYPHLILKPEIVCCTVTTIQFKAFLQSAVGEIELGQDVVFQSDNESVATINSSTGLATLVADGSAQIVAYWHELRTYSQVNVLAACQPNSFDILVDNSRSMSDRFNEVFETKLDVARAMAWNFAVGINLSKDLIGLTSFTTYPTDIVPIGSMAVTPANMASIQKSEAATSVLHALQQAVSDLNAAGNRGIIALFTDGESNPPLADYQRVQLLDLAKSFRQSGGVIIVVGIRAQGYGYELLQKIASPGYFVNVLADSGETHVDKAMSIISGLMQFICSPIPSLQLAYLYSPPATTYPVTPQTADPDPLELDGELNGVKPHYRGTRTYNNGSAPVSATCNSDVSQEDADARALELAMLRWTLLQWGSAYE